MDKKIVGLVVAIEMDSVFDYYSKRERLDCPSGYELYRCEKNNAVVYILRTGMGEIAAAAGVQYLITAYKVDIIVNFGVVGGLTHDMKKHKICVVDRVVHYRYDCSEFLNLKIGQVDGHDSLFLPTTAKFVEKALAEHPELFRAICCSGDKFVAREEEKTAIHNTFGGDVCDMESAGIVLICEANRVPCLLLKAVSDGLSGGAREFFAELYDASMISLKVADSIIETL